MKRTSHSPHRLPATAGTALILMATLTMVLAGGAMAQQKVQPETRLKLPAQELEAINKEELDKEKTENVEKDSKTGAATPSNFRENKVVEAGKLKDSRKLPAVQKNNLPAVQKPALKGMEPAKGKQQELPASKQPGTAGGFMPQPQLEKAPGAGGFVPNEAARETLKESLPAGTAGTNAPGRLQGTGIRVDGVDFLARPTGEPAAGRGAATGPIAVTGVNFVAHAESGTGGTSAGTAGAGPITVGAVNFIATPLPGESPPRSTTSPDGTGLRINSVHFIATPVGDR